MRRVGDAEWRWFGSRAEAARAFGLPDISSGVSRLIREPLKSSLRGSFEARPAQPKKRERPAPPKKQKWVDGATENSNGKWCNSKLFPGREFDDLDEYRAAKKQRAAQREDYLAQARDNKSY